MIEVEKLDFDKLVEAVSWRKDCQHYLDNLNEAGLRQLALMLLTEPDTKELIVRCIDEFCGAYEIMEGDE